MENAEGVVVRPEVGVRVSSNNILAARQFVLAGMGLAAVFAGAANTPLASAVMAMELFGPEAGVYAALACVVSYLCSGHAGIYRAQRVVQAKHGALPAQIRLADLPAWRAAQSSARPD